jgi:hypothetical protein
VALRIPPNRLLAAGALLWLGAASAAAEQPGARLKAVRAATPPAIDGAVGDAEWQEAAVATGFVQYEPQRGAPAEWHTEVLVLYDARHLYVAARLYDPAPLTARLTQRDANLFDDDAFILLLDTYHDRRTAYYFITNPLGTQGDGRITDDGRSSDATWDAAWQAAARPAESGWTVEIAIPWASIRFPAGTDRTFGINFGRSRRRTLELSAWTGPMDAWPRVSQSGLLTGLDLAPPADRVQVIPYGLTRLETGRPGDWEAGLDARYALTPTLSAYGTLFPDFATIEADQEQINLTRFEVSLREKRQFFLEGQELFGQRIRTFYSRRIADIEGGGKLLGKQGPWNVAVLAVATDPIGSAGRAGFTVGRLQRDVSARSNVAVMMTNRHLDGRSQGSVSIDSNLFFSKTAGMTAQFVKSYGPFGHGTEGFFLRPAYDTPTAHAHVRYSHLGERLADNLNATGQVRDDDRREIDSAVEKTFWRAHGPVQQVQYGSNYNIYWSQRNVLRSWQVDQDVEIEFRNRWNLQIEHTEEFKRFEKDFRNRQTGFQVGYNTREYQSVSVGYKTGRNFDADFRLWTVEAAYKATPQLSIEYSLERLSLDPDPDEESTWIHVVRANQSFTKDMFLRVFFQTNSAIDRQNVQAVFVWRYLPPFGTVQLAYQRGTAAFGERSNQGHTLFVKATTVF